MRRAAMVFGVVLGAWCAVPTAFGTAISVPESGAKYGDVPLSWGVTWGGAGIPTDHSAYREITDGDYTIRMAMRAHGRYSYDETADPSAPIYYVETGKFGGSGLDKDYAKWNFAFYGAVVDATGAAVTPPNNYCVKLLYDFAPPANTEASEHGSVTFTLPFQTTVNNQSVTVNPVQDSWNLAMGFLGTDSTPTIDAPSISFDPNLNGEYTFRLAVYKVSCETELGAVSMKVKAVPEPASMVALGGLGLVGAGWGFVRRRKLRGKA